MALLAIFPFVQVIVAMLLVIVILLQQKGAGLSGAFGGAGGFYRSRRGFEKTLFYATIVLASLFMLSGLVTIILNRS